MLLLRHRIALLRAAFALVVVLAVFVRPDWPIGSPIAFWVEFSGYLFLMAGLALRMWSILYVGGRKSQELVTHGPYSICRNPLYVGTMLLTLGAGLCFENILMLGVSVALIWPLHVVTVRLEEQRLEEIFGDEYRAYKERVPRYGFRRPRHVSPEHVTVSVRAIRRVALDTLGVLLLPQIEDLLELLHHEHIIPALWHFP